MNNTTDLTLIAQDAAGQARDNGGSRASVWVHSSWRVSSTWLWWRFRCLPNVLAYNEIFHEALATLVPESLPAIRPSGWDSGHPRTAGYFLEYAPLLRDGLGFDPAMSYQGFMPIAPDRSITEAEAAYVAGLIGMARKLGRTPVMTGVRTLGRVQGLSRHFGGCHIMLRRNLFRQWCSYSSQELNGNPYFVERTDVVLEQSMHDRFLSSLSEMYPQSASGEPHCARWHDFLRFAMLHLYLHALAHPDCKIDIEVDRLASDPGYREETRAAIAATAGLLVDLSDCRESIGISALPMDGQKRETVEAIRILAKEIPAFLPTWSLRQQELIDSQIAELESEIDRYAFYSRGLVHYILAGHSSLMESREAALNFPSERTERNRLVGEIAEARGMNELGQKALTAAEAKAVQARDEASQAQAEAKRYRAALEAAEARASEALGQVTVCCAENQRLIGAIEALHHSTSWRLTRPIRALKHFAHMRKRASRE